MIQAIVPTVAISQSILPRADKSLGPIGSSFRTLSYRAVVSLKASMLIFSVNAAKKVLTVLRLCLIAQEAPTIKL